MTKSVGKVPVCREGLIGQENSRGIVVVNSNPFTIFIIIVVVAIFGHKDLNRVLKTVVFLFSVLIFGVLFNRKTFHDMTVPSSRNTLIHHRNKVVLFPFLIVSIGSNTHCMNTLWIRVFF